MQAKVGEIYEGAITGITNFGAFVKLSCGDTGMVHISEIARGFVKDIHDHYAVGDTVRVKVIGINEEKISLSIKQLSAPAGAGASPAARPARPQNPQQAARTGPMSFEDMLSKFKQDSDDKISSLRRAGGESPRPRRGR